MKRLLPITITDAMLAASSIAEPASGEVAYNAAVTYGLGERVISVTSHRMYESMQASNIGHDPDADTSAAWWLDAGPSAKWAAFDGETNTASLTTTSYSVTVRPGFCNAICIFGAQGTAYSVVQKDSPGGTVIDTRQGKLYSPSRGLYDYLFVKRRQVDKLVLSSFSLKSKGEFVITISGPAGSQVGVGLIAFGHLNDLMAGSSWGSVQDGATAEPITYSYIKTDDYGKTTIKRRHKATGMAARIVMPRELLDDALAQIQEALDIPAVWVATDRPGFKGLNVYGLASASGSYDSFGVGTINIKVQGMI